MIKVIKPTLPAFDASIEVRGSIFNLRNVYEEGTGFAHIDISDEDGKFIDEFASGFGINLNDDDETVEYYSIKIFEYIDENLVF
jgi:hypothetical protein